MADQLSDLGAVIATALDNVLGTDWRGGGGGSGGAVDSVNGATGAVVLDADDIDDSATTNKFATAADLAAIGTAVQPGGDALETTDINAQTGTAYTLAASDRGQTVTMDNASANVVTIPTNTAVSLAVGTVVAVLQLGAGATSVTGASGVTVNGSDGGSVDVAAQWQGLSLTKIGTDAWVVSGGAA